MPTVFLLHGQNAVTLDQRVLSLRRELDPSDMGSISIDVLTSSIDEIASACHSAPFFGTGRLVNLSNVASTSGKGARRGTGPVEWTNLLDVIMSTPPTTTIVLRFEENLASNSIIMKAARGNGWDVEAYPVPRGEELARWVAERGDLAGVSISRGAAILLLSRLYPTTWRQETRFDSIVLDTRLIATEVEKLACAAVDGVVDEAVVKELVADRSGSTAFRLNDLIYSGQSEPALQELEQVLASGDEPERILAQLASESAGLKAASEVANYDGATVSRVSGISEGRLRMLRQKVVVRDDAALRATIERLRRAEWLVKTGRFPRSDAVIVSTAAEVSEEVRRSHG